jgi:hypothetical protein
MDERDYKDMNEELNQLSCLGLVSCRIISGCSDCPFNYEYDMAIGYGCKIDTENRSIRQSKKYQPITPDWCPVKKGSVVIKYGS